MLSPSHNGHISVTELMMEYYNYLYIECISPNCPALFTIAKTWKQPKCPLMDDWIRKMCYIYTMEYYSAIKKNKTMPFAATWMELEMLILSERTASGSHGED
uniref:DUF1725 domain-containing protein n=1 Tax=Sus scrofa TaxID=9823 RepID=A0A8D1HCN3_PIG